MLDAAKVGLPLDLPGCGKLLFDCQLVQWIKLLHQELDLTTSENYVRTVSTVARK